ncbi:MAG: hypothetical protein Q9183_002844 [Haloplaca sp. 2 TL-2023]
MHKIISSKTFTYTGQGFDWGYGLLFTPNIHTHMTRVNNAASQLNEFQELLRERVGDVAALQSNVHKKAMTEEVEDLHTKSMGWVMEMWKIGELFSVLFGDIIAGMDGRVDFLS